MSEIDSDNPLVLRQRITELENQLAEEQKKPFWTFDSWQDALKTVSLPIALIMALVAFWDTIILGAVGQDSKSIAQVRQNIEAIQTMDQKVYVLQDEGQDGRAQATEAAVVARRDRIVAETYDHWLRNPSYFRPAELQILTHHLILQYRTADALKVFEEYWRTRKTISQKAEAKLLEARIYAREGPVQDMEKAVGLLKEAFTISEGIRSSYDRLLVQGQILYKRGLTEIEREGGCDSAEPYADMLDEMATEGPSAILASAAADMRAQYTTRCTDRKSTG
ncbi:hypothetical protein [Sphingorhabdus sp. M41]|uniref:hypothetical protein n=1 Tax=Sphingorhabdus sp. M41 TaxID=1806885 RepID=UPI00078D75B1|nr:hypothetical protein [Sphingorhabdus sp. M41]AMO70708.1 hypothetical protein AZE99_01545 [Sphingorhabdus sp. M41]